MMLFARMVTMMKNDVATVATCGYSKLYKDNDAFLGEEEHAYVVFASDEAELFHQNDDGTKVP